MAIAAHMETERKYDAGAGARLPELRTIPGVTDVAGPRAEKLEAVYFDTADLRLARYGATLRRRTGGGDAGWHLKVPSGPDSRTELRLPLDESPEHATNAPPAELAELTTGMTRGADLRPVARIRTERQVFELLGADGKAIAEVTDDKVDARLLGETATVDRWREVEVELADGGTPAVLDKAEKLLRKAGIRRAGHGSKLARVLPAPATPQPGGRSAGDVVLAYLRTQVEAIVTQDLRVRRDEPDSVHQMRVAARRLRSALRSYKGLLRGTKPLADELRWLGRKLAGARDLEVQREHFQEEIEALPVELVVGPVAARLTKHYGPAEAAARRRVLKTLADRRYRRLLDELDRLLVDPPLTGRARRKAKKELPKHADRSYRRIERRRSSGAPLHEVRKAAKRYRYALEVAAPDGRARRRAKALTKVLGNHQDGVVAQPVLRELGMKAQLAGENGFTYGLLHEREQSRMDAAERAYPTAWKKLSKER